MTRVMMLQALAGQCTSLPSSPLRQVSERIDIGWSICRWINAFVAMQTKTEKNRVTFIRNNRESDTLPMFDLKNVEMWIIMFSLELLG
jgi:hypothetical protein